MLSFPIFFIVFALTNNPGVKAFPLSPTQVSKRRFHPLVSPEYRNRVSNSNVILCATHQFPTTRRKALGIALCGGILTNLLGTFSPMSANASTATASPASSAIAYRTIHLPVTEFGVEVPVSVWYPINDEKRSRDSLILPPEIKYDYKISLRRIGQLLAKWDFIPEFVSKDFTLTPSGASTIRVVDGTNIPIASQTNKDAKKVVFLAHGFLGSRSDLGYLAEELASQGFVCVAAEYPESLEASYPRLEGLDRAAINRRLIPFVQQDMMPQIASYSAIGHSLGCGTVLQMGDDTWSRVLMGSGRAPLSPSATNIPSKDRTKSVNQNPVVGGRLLFISSVNDGPVNSWGGGIQIPEEYTILPESMLKEEGAAAAVANLDRAAVVFGGERAPNHISYLSENVNDAMLSFLSPLLPLTKALDIPVLDFDKYSDSRDSVATGRVLKPLISGFLAKS